jgi:hypothetical protein
MKCSTCMPIAVLQLHRSASVTNDSLTSTSVVVVVVVVVVLNSIVSVASSDISIIFHDRDADGMQDELFKGQVNIPIAEVQRKQTIDQWFTLVGSNNEPLASKVHVALNYCDTTVEMREAQSHLQVLSEQLFNFRQPPASDDHEVLARNLSPLTQPDAIVEPSNGRSGRSTIPQPHHPGNTVQQRSGTLPMPPRGAPVKRLMQSQLQQQQQQQQQQVASIIPPPPSYPAPPRPPTHHHTITAMVATNVQSSIIQPNGAPSDFAPPPPQSPPSPPLSPLALAANSMHFDQLPPMIADVTTTTSTTNPTAAANSLLPLSSPILSHPLATATSAPIREPLASLPPPALHSSINIATTLPFREPVEQPAAPLQDPLPFEARPVAYLYFRFAIGISSLLCFVVVDNQLWSGDQLGNIHVWDLLVCNKHSVTFTQNNSNNNNSNNNNNSIL